VVIDMMEDVRTALNAGIDTALIDGAAGDNLRYQHGRHRRWAAGSNP
jgi:hypothetical protein